LECAGQSYYPTANNDDIKFHENLISPKIELNQ
jgi:hypothetical protein